MGWSGWEGGKGRACGEGACRTGDPASVTQNVPAGIANGTIALTTTLSPWLLHSNAQQMRSAAVSPRSHIQTFGEARGLNSGGLTICICLNVDNPASCDFVCPAVVCFSLHYFVWFCLPAWDSLTFPTLSLNTPTESARTSSGVVSRLLLLGPRRRPCLTHLVCCSFSSSLLGAAAIVPRPSS